MILIDGKRERAMTDPVSTGLEDMADFAHVVYCAGPAQLVYLTSAVQVSGIPPRNFSVQPALLLASDGLRSALNVVCDRSGMRLGANSSLLSPPLMDATSSGRSAAQTHHCAFWYCWGGRSTRPIMQHLRSTAPDIIIEYYDGFRSPIVASEQAKGAPSLFDATCLGDLRQLAVQRLMRPDRYFMPDDGLWKRYVPAEVQRRTDHMPLDLIRNKIRLVGKALEDSDSEQNTMPQGPDVVLATGMFSERREFASLVAEVKMYSDTLEAIRSTSRTASILVKTHPRTSPDKLRGLVDLCTRHSAALHTRQQLLEYILEKSGRRDVAVIGTPSTALVSTIQFGYGRAFCPSRQFMASYFGPGYADDHWMTRDHELMETAGVTMVDSLQQLRDMLHSKETS